MILFVLILGMILIKDAEIADSHTFSKDYMSIDNTNIIKGVFVLLVLLALIAIKEIKSRKEDL